MADKRLVVVAHGVDYSGGQEAVTARIVEYCLEQGWRVDIVAQRTSFAPRRGLRFFRIPVPKRPAALTFPLFWMISTPVLWLLKRGGAVVLSSGPITGGRVDVTCAHFCHKAFARVSTENRASKPTLLYRVNSQVDAVLHRTAERLLYNGNRTRWCVAVSKGVGQDIADNYPGWRGRTRVINNGVTVTLAPVNHREKYDLTAAFVGGDWSRKGLGTLIEALPLLPRWRVLVAGRGDRQHFEALAKRAGVSDRLVFLGQVSDVPAVHSQSDAYVLASTYEAFPLAALEAAASGLPLVATAVNGVVELFTAADVGSLVERSSESIASGLMSLEDVEQRRRKGARARQLVSNLSWERQLSEYGDHLARLWDQCQQR